MRLQKNPTIHRLKINSETKFHDKTKNKLPKTKCQNLRHNELPEFKFQSHNT